PGLYEHIIPAPIPNNAYKKVQELAVMAHKVLSCRDLSRVDFILPDKGEPVILEVNTIPGMTPTSLYPDAARAFGISFEELVAHLVERAIGRAKGIARKNNL
ncbi:MAG: D-alanine--D-alanine ligase, partial [candidate division WOR-3 bacterium]|nr:D-alanine--D-alanine ligase [candidate division WOR-3 bacterium]